MTIASFLWLVVICFIGAFVCGVIYQLWIDHEEEKAQARRMAEEASRRSLAAACHVPRPWKETAAKGFGRKDSGERCHDRR